MNGGLFNLIIIKAIRTCSQKWSSPQINDMMLWGNEQAVRAAAPNGDGERNINMSHMTEDVWLDSSYMITIHPSPLAFTKREGRINNLRWEIGERGRIVVRGLGSVSVGTVRLGQSGLEERQLEGGTLKVMLLHVLHRFSLCCSMPA